jgi:hypothetical protein
VVVDRSHPSWADVDAEQRERIADQLPLRTADHDRTRYLKLPRQPELIFKPSSIPRLIRIAMSFSGHCRDPLRAEALNQRVIVRD